MNFDLGQATQGVHQLVSSFTQRLPYLAIAIVVFIVFYVAGVILKKVALTIVARTQRHRSVGIVLGLSSVAIASAPQQPAEKQSA